MPTNTPNYNLALYNSTSDQAVSFADFRAAIAGPTDSNMTKIDTALANLAATRGLITVAATYISTYYYEATVAAISGYIEDIGILFIPDTTNPGYVTLNINGLGTKYLKKTNAAGAITNIEAGDLLINKEYIFRYDGTQWVWVQQQLPVLDDSITTSKILNDAVTTAKIANLNVTTAKIADLNVTTGKIADLNVTTGKIADLGVTTAKIADYSITTAKIANSAVNNDKIATATITGNRLVNGTVTATQLASPLGIGMEKIDEVVLDSNGIVEFTSIPSDYRNLKIVYQTKRAGIVSYSDTVLYNRIRFNGDASTDKYENNILSYFYGSGYPGGFKWDVYTQTNAFGMAGAARNNEGAYAAYQWTQGEINIINYAGTTTHYRFGYSDFYSPYATPSLSGDFAMGRTQFTWRKTDAIVSIQICCQPDTFNGTGWGGLLLAGSIFTLYGLA